MPIFLFLPCENTVRDEVSKSWHHRFCSIWILLSSFTPIFCAKDKIYFDMPCFMFLRLIIFSTRQRNLFHFNQSNNLLCLLWRCVCITKICTLQTSNKLLGLKEMKLYLLLSMLDLIAKFPTVVFHLISNWQGYFQAFVRYCCLIRRQHFLLFCVVLRIFSYFNSNGT